MMEKSFSLKFSSLKVLETQQVLILSMILHLLY